MMSLMLMLALSATAAGEATIAGPLKVPAGSLVKLDIAGVSAGDKTKVTWRVRDKDGKPVEVLGIGTRAVFTGLPGPYRVELRVIDFKAELFEEAEATVTIGDAPPPVPPGPTPPGPTPPDPKPVPVGPLRALIVYETAELPKMPAGQRTLLFDAKVRGALKDRTDKGGPDGRGWNIWDKDTDVSQMGKFWKDAMARPRPSVPYVHLFKGDAIAFEGPLPADSDAMLNLVNKYAGG
jgi:hypothetical protein